ncbi:dihydrolipoyl dehydrogenase [Microbacterium aurantiacum]|uniref:Dihydrolipoyl dehydrogenase n=1 Tax=Microbacterium aurantiacum TaxID=162393 RepID=A0AAJ2HIC4_9MICO|nr:dihydrolipoyl dehydrogenase [Microbacterium aurantiacum]MDN4463238.1 dihydrolipoyl dehydrogenase [Microbacterium aurantiacum]MDS0246187.1 dihydrolipoyl dehydrogenase [Microbacterium aurantiacum]ODT11406.1 MAG: dihydrolipoyl dehydrogenase [Microbacterium sp. SCN 70-18]
MSEHVFDAVVLGGGSGGYAAAIRLSELGRSVALIEKDKVGGTCLHRGCVPTKALLHVAEVADVARDAASVGVIAEVQGLDPDRMRAYREGIVAKKYQGLQGLLSARGITVVAGEGTLVSGPAVAVGDDIYRGTDVIVATGSYSRTLPGVEVGGRILTSETALELPEVPRRVIVLGGGVIGVEFASLWRSLGVEVVIVEALDHLVPNEDPALRKGLERAFRKRGIVSHLGVRVAGVDASPDEVSVRLENGTSLTADYLLVAVGRGPATAGLGLEEAGVALDRGFVVTDDRLRTDAAHVWAVGDIVPGLQLAHRSFQQGVFVAEEIAGLDPVIVPETQIPRVTYSHPEIASVGLTEAQAVDAHGRDRVAAYEYNLAGNAKSEIIGTAGVAKVVRMVDGPIVGVHLVGDRVGELISEGQLAVGWEAHPEDIAPFVHAHPTQSEALGEAFLALAGKPLHAL